MSNVVISNRSIFNQRIVSIEKNKVHLPFNVNKELVKKLAELLVKIKVTFLCELDKLKISDLSYNDINVKPRDRRLNNCKFTLSKTYVVTIKQTFITKVKTFYERLAEFEIPERPVFSIGNEVNLQAALAEATAEIDLSAINSELPTTVADNAQSQVLANNPLGETVIENPVNLNNGEQVNIQAPIAESNPVLNGVAKNTQVQSQENNVNVAVQSPMSSQPVDPVQPIIQVPADDAVKQPVKKKFFSKRGNVLAIPIIVIWLGLVFFGTLKLVTGILT